MSVSPLLRRDGVAGQGERLVLLAVFLAPIAFVFLSGTVSLVAGILMSVGLLAWIMRGRTLYLHGAEHRAIAAAEEGKLAATWAGRGAAVALLAALRDELRRARLADRRCSPTACGRSRLRSGPLSCWPCSRSA